MDLWLTILLLSIGVALIIALSRGRTARRARDASVPAHAAREAPPLKATPAKSPLRQNMPRVR